MDQMAAVDVKSAVCNVYGTVAAREDGSQQEGARRVAQAFGYSVLPKTQKYPLRLNLKIYTHYVISFGVTVRQDEELASIPQEANMGLSCGNSVKYANLNEAPIFPHICSSGSIEQRIIMLTTVLHALLLRVKWWWTWGVEVVWTASLLPRKVRILPPLRPKPFFCWEFSYLRYVVGKTGSVIGVDMTEEVSIAWFFLFPLFGDISQYHVDDCFHYTF